MDETGFKNKTETRFVITIIDYGAGNIGSIANMIRKIGKQSKVTSNKDEIYAAEKLILPGVGHFDHGMSKIKESGLIEVLNKKVIDEKCPILGICLGAQLMTKSSEEGNLAGLGWFDADVKRFASIQTDGLLRIPHMGWNYVNLEKETPLTYNMEPDSRFYFVHSYYIDAYNAEDILFSTNYGKKFVSGLNHGNMYAVQFHPEKSHKFGIALFKNFLDV